MRNVSAYELMGTQNMVRACLRIEARVIHTPCNGEPLSKIGRLPFINIKYQQVHSDKPMSVAGSPSYRPGARFWKVPVTFRARNQIFKSKYKE